ncbi:MAG: alpha/beta fold hydrolase [Polyangiaceae bacterium]
MSDVQRGASRRPQVVLVHGALADGRMWEPHAEQLAPHFETFAPTLSRFGIDGEASSGGFGIRSHARDLLRAIDEPGLEFPHLAAWSYGADVALEAALLAPERIASLFLYEPGYPGALSETDAAAFGEDAQAMFAPLFALAAERKLSEAAAKLVDASAQSPGYFARQPDAVRAQQLENAHTLVSQLSQNEPSSISADTLARLELPVAVAYGELTRPLFRLVSVTTARLVTGAETQVSLGVGHMFPLESPRQFTSQLTRFLRSVDAG